MDISLEIGEYMLNYRVSALIKKDNQILVHHGIEKDHYTLPGGRVQAGESSIDALRREIKEEMGFETEYMRPVSLIENFFEMNNKNYHELLITHELKLKDIELYKQNKYDAIEEIKKGKLEFLWMDIEKLNEKTLLPKGLNTIITENKNEFVHYINDERIK